MYCVISKVYSAKGRNNYVLRFRNVPVRSCDLPLSQTLQSWYQYHFIAITLICSGGILHLKGFLRQNLFCTAHVPADKSHFSPRIFPHKIMSRVYHGKNITVKTSGSKDTEFHKVCTPVMLTIIGSVPLVSILRKFNCYLFLILFYYFTFQH